MVESVDSDDDFSYAAPDDPRLKRFVIRLIERMTGQPYLKWLYDDHRHHPIEGETFWEAAVRRLELNVVYDKARLQALPKHGPVVVVSNHPFGVLDGIVLCYLVSRVRPDFRVLINSVLYRAEEIRPYMLPIDFAETDEAVKTNLKSRAEAKHHLMKGGCLVVFPAGGVSTTPKFWDRRAVDAEWKTFTARLISQSNAPVVPVYFAGQNSRLFQFVSHISMTLRLSLLFKEVHDRIGSEIHVRIGDVMPYDRLRVFADRYQFMDYLKRSTYALGLGLPNPPRSRVKRPRRAPKHGRSFSTGASAQ